MYSSDIRSFKVFIYLIIILILINNNKVLIAQSSTTKSEKTETSHNSTEDRKKQAFGFQLSGISDLYFTLYYEHKTKPVTFLSLNMRPGLSLAFATLSNFSGTPFSGIGLSFAFEIQLDIPNWVWKPSIDFYLRNMFLNGLRDYKTSNISMNYGKYEYFHLILSIKLNLLNFDVGNDRVGFHILLNGGINFFAIGVPLWEIPIVRNYNPISYARFFVFPYFSWLGLKVQL